MCNPKKRSHKLLLVVSLLLVSLLLSSCNHYEYGISISPEGPVVQVGTRIGVEPFIKNLSRGARFSKFGFLLISYNGGEFEEIEDCNSNTPICYFTPEAPGTYVGFVANVTYSIAFFQFGGNTDKFEIEVVELSGGGEDLVELEETTLVMTTSPNPSRVDEEVAISVAVTGAREGVIPIGLVFVRISEDAFDCEILLDEHGEGSCPWMPSRAGFYFVNADYVGVVQFASSFDASFHVVEESIVERLESTTSIDRVISPNLSMLGETALFYVSVSGEKAVPTGSVYVSGAGGSCTAALDSNGQGSCSYVMKMLGQHTITAAYGGDEVYDGSSTTISYGVVAPTPTPTAPYGGLPCNTSVDSDCDGVSDPYDDCPYEGDQGKGVDAIGCPIK